MITRVPEVKWQVVFGKTAVEWEAKIKVCSFFLNLSILSQSYKKPIFDSVSFLCSRGQYGVIDRWNPAFLGLCWTYMNPELILYWMLTFRKCPKYVWIWGSLTPCCQSRKVTCSLTTDSLFYFCFWLWLGKQIQTWFFFSPLLCC